MEEDLAEAHVLRWWTRCSRPCGGGVWGMDRALWKDGARHRARVLGRTMNMDGQQRRGTEGVIDKRRWRRRMQRGGMGKEKTRILHVAFTGPVAKEF